MKKPDGTPRHPHLSQLRNLFFAGLFVTVPIFLTFWLLQWAFNKLDGPFRRFLEERLAEMDIEVRLYGVGLVILVLFIMFVGVLARLYAGKLLIGLFEALLGRLPVVNTVYRGIKQITDAILGSKKGLFQEVVLVEYPRRGMWSLGFYTADTTRHIADVIDVNQRLRYVFIPTTPNPTSGYLLLVPEEDVRIVDIAVEDAIKLIVSGGAVSPEAIPSVVHPIPPV
ncbi:DUF502 domain-containing protein [bacterium]|nr:DUF502 domain-containing protein [bacterium]